MTNITKAIEVAAKMCRHFEGFRSHPYYCSAGFPTIGYGTVYKPDGTKVTMDDAPISRETADEWLVQELRNNYLAGVLKASPNLIAYPMALAAITDFAYNLGVGRYRGSTLRRRVNEADWEGVQVELAKWIRGGGRVLPGLVRRRKAEIALFMS